MGTMPSSFRTNKIFPLQVAALRSSCSCSFSVLLDRTSLYQQLPSARLHLLAVSLFQVRDASKVNAGISLATRNTETREEGARPLSPLVLFGIQGFPPEMLTNMRPSSPSPTSSTVRERKELWVSGLTTASGRRAAAASKLNRAGAKEVCRSSGRAQARFFAEAKPSPRCEEKDLRLVRGPQLLPSRGQYYENLFGSKCISRQDLG